MAGGWFLCLSWGLNTILPASAGPQLSPPSCVALGKSLYSVSQFPHLWAGFTAVPTSVCGGPMGFTERGACHVKTTHGGRGAGLQPFRGDARGASSGPPTPGLAQPAAAPPAGRFLPSPPPRTPASERKPPGPGGRPFLSASSFPHSARGSGPGPTGRAERRGRAAPALRDRGAADSAKPAGDTSAAGHVRARRPGAPAGPPHTGRDAPASRRPGDRPLLDAGPEAPPACPVSTHCICRLLHRATTPQAAAVTIVILQMRKTEAKEDQVT